MVKTILGSECFAKDCFCAVAKRFHESILLNCPSFFQFPPGDGTYAGTLWTSLDTLTEGNNVLAVRLIDNGGREPFSTRVHEWEHVLCVPVLLTIESDP